MSVTQIDKRSRVSNYLNFNFIIYIYHNNHSYTFNYHINRSDYVASKQQLQLLDSTSTVIIKITINITISSI